MDKKLLCCLFHIFIVHQQTPEGVRQLCFVFLIVTQHRSQKLMAHLHDFRLFAHLAQLLEKIHGVIKNHLIFPIVVPSHRGCLECLGISTWNICHGGECIADSYRD